MGNDIETVIYWFNEFFFLLIYNKSRDYKHRYTLNFIIQSVHSILTGDTRVECLIYYVLSTYITFKILQIVSSFEDVKFFKK